MTYLMLGIVTDVSATLVDTTHTRVLSDPQANTYIHIVLQLQQPPLPWLAAPGQVVNTMVTPTVACHQ